MWLVLVRKVSIYPEDKELVLPLRGMDAYFLLKTNFYIHRLFLVMLYIFCFFSMFSDVWRSLSGPFIMALTHTCLMTF